MFQIQFCFKILYFSEHIMYVMLTKLYFYVIRLLPIQIFATLLLIQSTIFKAQFAVKLYNCYVYAVEEMYRSADVFSFLQTILCNITFGIDDVWICFECDMV